MGSTIVTAGILLTSILVFILLISISHKKARTREKLNKEAMLSGIVEANGLLISEKEYLAHHLIAFDELNATLVFIDFRNNESTSTVVKLHSIKSLQVDVVTEELFEEKKGKKHVTGKRTANIQLVLNHRNSNETKTYLTFYEVIINNIAEKDYLKSRADYWGEKISRHIQNRAAAV